MSALRPGAMALIARRRELSPAQRDEVIEYLVAHLDCAGLGTLAAGVAGAIAGAGLDGEPLAAGAGCRYCGTEAALLIHTRAGAQCSDGVACARRQYPAAGSAA